MLIFIYKQEIVTNMTIIPIHKITLSAIALLGTGTILEYAEKNTAQAIEPKSVLENELSLVVA